MRTILCFGGFQRSLCVCVCVCVLSAGWKYTMLRQDNVLSQADDHYDGNREQTSYLESKLLPRGFQRSLVVVAWCVGVCCFARVSNEG
jgi:hypothetical protein